MIVAVAVADRAGAQLVPDGPPAPELTGDGSR